MRHLLAGPVANCVNHVQENVFRLLFHRLGSCMPIVRSWRFMKKAGRFV